MTRTISLIALTAALAGCFSSGNHEERCTEIEEYQSSTSIPGVVTPEDLSDPKPEAAYAVPPGQEASADQSATCLARPPDYFRKDDARAGAAPLAPVPPADPGTSGPPPPAN